VLATFLCWRQFFAATIWQATLFRRQFFARQFFARQCTPVPWQPCFEVVLTWKPQVPSDAVRHADVGQNLALVDHGVPEKIRVRPHYEAVSEVAAASVAADVDNAGFPLSEVWNKQEQAFAL
jgi:hypothetical protein